MPHRHPGVSRRAAILFAAIVAAVLSVAALSGCGGSSGNSSTAKPPAIPSAVVATATTTLNVYPAADSTIAVRTLPPTQPTGTQQVLLVTGRNGNRYEVLLPVRPNGSHGWVDGSQVSLTRTDLSVDLSLSNRHLRVLRNGSPIVDTPAAVGAPDTPTPTGLFYITDLLTPTNADGGYGPYAFGLSGYSDVFLTFAGGDGEVGLHGTNDPASIGNAVTHGCIRVDNAVITQLSKTLGLGTPILVHA